MQHAHKSAFGQAEKEGGRWRMSDILVLSFCGCHFVCGIKRFRSSDSRSWPVLGLRTYKTRICH